MPSPGPPALKRSPTSDFDEEGSLIMTLRPTSDHGDASGQYASVKPASDDDVEAASDHETDC